VWGAPARPLDGTKMGLYPFSKDPLSLKGDPISHTAKPPG